MSQNPPWFDDLLHGLAEIARADLKALDAGERPSPGNDVAFTRALIAREQFLADMDRLTTAPGATAAEVAQAAAGILTLAAEGD